jgi:MFS transporter, OFA family, oxalate/formate antiporter
MTIAKIVGFASATGHTALVGTTAAVGLAVTNGFGRPVLGRLADRLGYEITMTGSFTLCGLFLLLMIAGASPLLFVIAALVALFFWGPLFSLFPAISGYYYGADHAAAIYGILYSAKMVGGLWGGWASALILERYGYQTAFIIGAAMAIVSGMLMLIVRRKPPI